MARVKVFKLLNLYRKSNLCMVKKEYRNELNRYKLLCNRKVRVLSENFAGV